MPKYFTLNNTIADIFKNYYIVNVTVAKSATFSGPNFNEEIDSYVTAY